MSRVSWTGHPFVDAGLSAIASLVKKAQLEALKPEHLKRASHELSRILLSDQALGRGTEKSFARGALSQLFPNSELVNPSNWKGGVESVKKKFKEALDQDLQLACRCLEASGDTVCSLCGQLRPSDAMVFLRKSKLPLMEGVVNFYPAFSVGMRACGLCAFAVRFLPLTVLHTGRAGRLWLLHT